MAVSLVQIPFILPPPPPDSRCLKAKPPITLHDSHDTAHRQTQWPGTAGAEETAAQSPSNMFTVITYLLFIG